MGVWGAVAPIGLVLDSAINVDNYVFAARQVNIARDCACLGLEVANYGGDYLRIGHLISFRPFGVMPRTISLAWLDYLADC